MSSAGGAQARDPTAGLRIATWNLDWLNRRNEVGPVKRSDEDYARLRRYAEKLDADVVALQEVDGLEAARRVFDPKKYEVYVAAQQNPQRTGFAYRKDLKVAIHPDYAALDVGHVRVGADISVELGGRVVRLLSVHLKSGCFSGALTDQGKDCRKLVAQLPSLEEWIDARGEEATPAIVLGDFNRRLFARPDEPFWRELDDQHPPASDLWSPTEGQRAGCWGGAYPDFIDHIVLNKPATALVVQDSFVQLVYDERDRAHKAKLSDHCPIAVTLSPTPRAASAAPPSATAARALPVSEGKIKGNVGKGGKKIYHAPDCPGYARTKIDPAKGERFFLSEAEAEAAGFHRAGNCP